MKKYSVNRVNEGICRSEKSQVIGVTERSNVKSVKL